MNDIESYMYIEWLESREYVTAIKRQKQRSAKKEYQRTGTQRQASETSSCYILCGEEAIRKFKEEDEE